MSPELFDPELPGNPRTKSSDCYAFGMVIYEVLSGHVPFHQYENLAVPVKVCGGERPERPEGSEGVWLVGVWVLLERCWTPRPNERPAIKDLLECLVEASRIWTPPSPRAIASASTTDSPVWNTFDTRTEQSTGWGGISSPSQAAPSQPSEKLPPKCDTDDNSFYSSAHESSAPLYRAPDHQDLEVYVEGFNSPDTQESMGIVNKVG
jgi:hypothetical protein